MKNFSSPRSQKPSARRIAIVRKSEFATIGVPPFGGVCLWSPNKQLRFLPARSGKPVKPEGSPEPCRLWLVAKTGGCGLWRNREAQSKGEGRRGAVRLG